MLSQRQADRIRPWTHLATVLWPHRTARCPDDRKECRHRNDYIAGSGVSLLQETKEVMWLLSVRPNVERRARNEVL